LVTRRFRTARQLFDGIGLHCRDGVRMDVHRDRDRRVTELYLDDFRVDTRAQGQRAADREVGCAADS
jgi:hypothetical protein